ncbi:hypothetical protein JXA84_06235 [candidate division WOR-3 bacterium]|nr:hypothetical protein [candidate division WOR-3 bacterium]
MNKCIFAILLGLTLQSCSKDPLEPYPKPFASLKVTPESAYISSAEFTVDASGSFCAGLSSDNLWARVSWDFFFGQDSSIWCNWTGLQAILNSPPTVVYNLDTNQTFPLLKVISLEIANPDGISDTAFDTITILRD